MTKTVIMAKEIQQQVSRKGHLLVLDIGTTGVKGFVFTSDLEMLSRAYEPLQKYFPKRGRVEQDPLEMLSVSQRVLRKAIKESNVAPNTITGLGIANQRETTILWDSKTGEPVYPAMVWEDTRTMSHCKKLQEKFGVTVIQKTGLRIDPYFSGSKVQWILKHNKKAQTLLEKNTLLFGTVDSWILWNWLSGSPHVTDYTNASRTLLFNIKTLTWDPVLLNMFHVPHSILPAVQASQSLFGELKKEVLGFVVPIVAVCGDQQASMYAAGVETGSTKITYGTGTFIMQSIGESFAIHAPFFTTLIPGHGEPFYAVEAKINASGQEITAALGNDAKLKICLTRLAKHVDRVIKKLPIIPQSLTIDGGITRDGIIAQVQERISCISVRGRQIFDGTALGVAMLIRDSVM